jgi:hypothetical protein
MNQREKISNNFSDAYLLALLEERNGQDVLAKFSKEFPELAQEFEANARSLWLMYGGIGSVEKPSENEISTAYKKVSEKLDSKIPHSAHSVAPVSGGFFATLKSFFSTSPTWAGASLGIGVAVIIALLWQPWVIKESMRETAHHPNVQPASPSKQFDNFAFDDQKSSDPSKMPEVQYRGKKEKQLLSTAQKKQQDSIDEARLKQMAEPKPLAAPNNLQAEPDGAGAIKLSWNPTPGALSYIVEIRAENDAHFDPVTQISQSRARITLLESGKTYYIRVIAASGERVGQPSDVKSISIP